jgi:hypothetical protein
MVKIAMLRFTPKQLIVLKQRALIAPAGAPQRYLETAIGLMDILINEKLTKGASKDRP